MKKIFILLVFPALLSGCGLYSKYQRPKEIAVSDTLYRTQIEDSISIAQLSWKELFKDPILQRHIDSGLVNNSDLQIARLRVTQSEASLQSARLAYLPSVSLSPQANTSLSGYGSGSPSYNLAASASWELDIFGKLTNAKLGAKSALEKSVAYEQAVQTKLISTIANSYYTLLMLDRQLEISRETAQMWGENVRVIRALKMAGRSTEAAVSQALASKISVEASLFTLEKQINEMENTLSVLLGIVPQKIERGSLGEYDFPQELSVGVPLQLLSKRPDVRQAEQNLAQAFYATNQARAAFYPTITLGGTAGWTNSLGAIINPGSWLLSAVGSLVQPLFNRGLNTSKLKIAKAQQEEALVSFQQQLLNAGAEVNNALVQWQTARKRLVMDVQQIDALKKAVESSKLLMQHSDASYLEVLTAQQTLLNAQLSEVNDRFGEIQGVINLYHSLGGGC